MKKTFFSAITLLLTISLLFTSLCGLNVAAEEANPTADTELIRISEGSGMATYKIQVSSAIDLSTFKITYNDGGYSPKVSISADQSEWIALDCDATNEWGWRYYTYSGELESLAAGYYYVLIDGSETANWTSWGANPNPTNLSYEYTAFIDPAADSELILVSTGNGMSTYKIKVSNAINLKTFKITYQEQGYTPKVSISADQSEWIALDCDDTNEWGWRYYTYSGELESLAAGYYYVLIDASETNLWITWNASPNPESGEADHSLSYEYTAFIDPAADSELILVSTGNGMATYKINISKTVNLSTFKITINHEGYTPKVSISDDQSTWIALDCDDTNVWGWRYYTYSGELNSLSAGYYYVLVDMSETNHWLQWGKNPTPTNLSYEYSTFDKGDVTMNGEVDILDLVRLKKITVNICLETEFSDINGDNSVDGIDLVELRKMLLVG